MKFNLTIANINQQLISAFAMLDSWLDRLVEDDNDEDYLLDIIEHVLISNDQWLRLISTDRDTEHYALRLQSIEGVSKHALLRRWLRDQLHSCLLLLDIMEANQIAGGTDDVSRDNIERLYAICYHLNHHLESFETSGLIEG